MEAHHCLIKEVSVLTFPTKRVWAFRSSPDVFVQYCRESNMVLLTENAPTSKDTYKGCDKGPDNKDYQSQGM